ncbi:MAG: DUF262 domain-containing HNH endonuclease family protein [Fibromonadales bacterium]|nr:DUF262 domain-containing HNH endonuclease family protein [Fibromonadales bacterium]
MAEELKLTEVFSIRDLFSSDSYEIPIYQRNYAWGKTEITQLIQDIADYCHKDQKYFIGTLIVYDKSGKFSTIDGQQRLTTLTILLNLIKNKYLEKYPQEIDLDFYKNPDFLKFESRDDSNDILKKMFGTDNFDDNNCNFEIKNGYKNAETVLKKICKETDVSIPDFCKYLFDKVMVLRVLIPAQSNRDLNHYFEIMNSRGEQLEKHEILKANCLAILNESEKYKSDQYAFNLIWSACSNMEKYVQYGFDTTVRERIFGKDWNALCCIDDIYELGEELSKNERIIFENEEQSPTMEFLLTEDAPDYYEMMFGEGKNQLDKDSPERFNTIINFPNFLLHILNIQVKKYISLDDKNLIDSFEGVLCDEKDKAEFVREFGYNLLKCKFLFDKYIIKREFTKGTDHWSLKQYKRGQKENYPVNTFPGKGKSDEDDNDGINREILMLLSMFHVTFTAMTDKYWLNAALKFVFENENAEPQKYKSYLENLARVFFYRTLKVEPYKYHKIIYGDKCLVDFTKDFILNNSDYDMTKLDKGTKVENFVFNYLDYLLWLDYRKENSVYVNFKDKRIGDFEFTFRSSVEHYQPQNAEYSILQTLHNCLDNFGNLCLISNDKNARLNNRIPLEKKKYYDEKENIDSIKQCIMMKLTEHDWTEKEIADHGSKMREVLLNSNIFSL